MFPNFRSRNPGPAEQQPQAQRAACSMQGQGELPHFVELSSLIRCKWFSKQSAEPLAVDEGQVECKCLPPRVRGSYEYVAKRSEGTHAKDSDCHEV